MPIPEVTKTKESGDYNPLMDLIREALKQQSETLSEKIEQSNEEQNARN